MADINSTVVTPIETVGVPDVDIIMAKHRFNELSKQLEQICAVAAAGRRSEECIPEDLRNTNGILLFEVITDLAEDATCVYALGDFFEKYAPAEVS